MHAPPPLHSLDPLQRRGLWLGLLGVFIFALTLPMTRLATGTPEAPQLPGLYIAAGRAVVAAVLSALFLLAVRAPLPRRADWKPLALVAGGVVFGFPICTSIAMRHVEAVHASVIVGVLPLATAAVGAALQRQRPSPGFWLCALVGTALVVSLRRAALGQRGAHAASGRWAAVAGHALRRRGLRLRRAPGAAHARGAGDLLGPAAVPAPDLAAHALELAARRPPAAAWGGFAYVAVFSMWLGFFAWYRGLAWAAPCA